jgi:SAM-dependent methyltransferase
MTSPEQLSHSFPENYLLERKIKVEEWRDAPHGLHYYPAGKVYDNAGKMLYEYDEGIRLWIGKEKQVMDSCQRPWVKEAVRLAFSSLTSRQIVKNIDVLECGWGLGIAAKKILENLRLTGGTYTAIELNKSIYEYMNNEWVSKQAFVSIANDGSELGSKKYEINDSRVPIELTEGDDIEEISKLAAKQKKYDLIFRDSFPLVEADRSVNDLRGMNDMIKILKPTGVFTFFGYYSGYQGGLNEKQRNLLEGYFDNITRINIPGINPPPDYEYLNPPGKSPVRELPVIICTGPRIPSFA